MLKNFDIDSTGYVQSDKLFKVFKLMNINIEKQVSIKFNDELLFIEDGDIQVRGFSQIWQIYR